MDDKEIIKDFVDESKNIVKECLKILDSVEGNFANVKLLETYGNNIDRIMGGAKTLGLDVSSDSVLAVISDYSAVCKNVGYKAGQITENEAFFDVCVGLLIDASEMLMLLLDKMDLPLSDVKKSIPEEFIERLRWVLKQFRSDLRSTVGASSAMSQDDVDTLLSKISG